MAADRLTKARPLDGDVVVERNSATTFSVRVWCCEGDEVPITVAPRDEAIRLGRDLAITSGVNLWYYYEDSALRLLEVYRSEGLGPTADQ